MLEPITLITFGETLVAFTLLVAFLQFTTPIIDFRINVKYKNGVNSFVLSIIRAIVLIFISKLIQFYEVPLTKIFAEIFKSYPLMVSGLELIDKIPLFEILGCYIMCHVFYNMATVTKKTCSISQKNCKKYLEECKRIIVRGVDTELRELGAEICDSMPTIIECALRTSTPESEACKELLSIFARPNFCKSLVLHNGDTCFEFVKTFQNIDKKKLDDMPESIEFVQQLIKQAFNNENSILYNDTKFLDEIKNKSVTFTELAFGNLNFVESAFDPLNVIDLDKDCLDNPRLHIFFCVIMSVVKLFSSDKNVTSGKNIKEFLFRINKKIFFMESSERNSIIFVEIIIFFWGKLLGLVGESEDQFTQIDNLKYNVGNAFKDQNNALEDLIADLVVDCINILSWRDECDESTENLLSPILNNPLWKINPKINRIIKNIEFNIFKEDFISPRVTRVLLNTCGLSLINEEKESCYDFHVKLLEYVRNFKILYKKGEERKFLPTYMFYNETENCICDGKNFIKLPLEPHPS